MVVDAAFVLDANGCVHAFPSVQAAKDSFSPVQLGSPVFCSWTGATQKGKPEEVALLQPAAHKPQPLPGITSVLDESLLRTNMQKAIRRKLPDATHGSVMQILAQLSPDASAADVKKLLLRFIIIAAEDCGLVTSSSLAMFEIKFV